MTDVSILVMVAASFVFQVSDATVGRFTEDDFTWKYNGEVNIGKPSDLFLESASHQKCRDRPTELLCGDHA